MADTAVVEVKSGWFSKVNWTQVATFGASMAAVAGLNVSADTLLQIVLGIQAVQSIATIIIKTWFTKSVTAPSVAKT